MELVGVIIKRTKAKSPICYFQVYEMEKLFRLFIICLAFNCGIALSRIFVPFLRFVRFSVCFEPPSLDDRYFILIRVICKDKDILQ